MNRFFLLTSVILLVAGITTAQTVWKLDKAHSYVRFSVSHMAIGEVTGRFTDFDVSMTSTKDDLTDAIIEATIKTASINTDNSRRDDHLRSDDFLNVASFSVMTFKSSSLEMTGKGMYKIHGDLTIRDITKPVILDTKFNGTIRDQRGNTKAGFKSVTTINRFEFGTKWNLALDSGGFVAGEDVEITIATEFSRQESSEEKK